MGAPTEGSGSAFRNPMHEVQRFLEEKHAGRYKVYDLRAEKGASYDSAKFNDSVSAFRFYDHNPAPVVRSTEIISPGPSRPLRTTLDSSIGTCEIKK